MRKILSFILSAIVVTGMFAAPVKAEAAMIDSKAGTVSVTSGNLNVRSSASTDSSIITSLSKGSYVTLISRSGSWWRVEYTKGKYGYCHADYISSLSSSTATVATESSNLNVRSGPGTGNSIIGSLPRGELVVVISTSNGWSKVLYHGTKTGYVSTQYLSFTQQSYSAISLNVPDFKQSDSRWANVLIGNSGKTMAKIGCVTTGIAMMESYRSGNTIYPDAMSKKLTYDSNGNVYWPSDYTVVTNSNGYLEGIYELLKQGKPVLIGFKTSAGNQHWVVVTGYTGGSTLTASGFTINDPATNSRSNLQQLINDFPTFYKYFYY